MKCPNCNFEISPSDKFCNNCGNLIERANETKEVVEVNETSQKIDEPISNTFSEAPVNNNVSSLSSSEKSGNGIEKLWKNADTFAKALVIILALSLILGIVSVCIDKVVPIIISLAQLIGIITAFFIHKGIIKINKNWIKYPVITGVVILFFLNIRSYSWTAKTPSTNQNSEPFPAFSEELPAMLKIPVSASDCIGKPYADIDNLFYSAGFTNITYETVEDLKFRESDKLDTVNSVCIDGKTDFKADEEIERTSNVLIQCHAYADCTLKLHVDFIPNLIFSKYDVTLKMNDREQGTLKHGNDGDFEFKVKPVFVK